jgi:hypothetical protein
MVEVGPMPYPVFNTILDEGYPKGALNYWLSAFTTGLTDGLSVAPSGPSYPIIANSIAIFFSFDFPILSTPRLRVPTTKSYASVFILFP